MARTFALSYDRLDGSDPADAQAIRLLARAACLAPGEPIPRDLLLTTLEITEDDRATQRQAEQGLLRLVALGLLDAEADGALRLHRLIHTFVGNSMADPEALGAVEDALIRAASQLNNTGYPGAMQPIAAHLRYVTERAQERDDERVASLCGHLAYNLYKLGEYGAARPLSARALAIREQTLGPTHPDTATSLNNLAEIFRAVGDYGAARPLYARALAISEQTLGPTHPDTATSLNNLAALLTSVGEYGAARPLSARALVIYEQTLGPTHPDTASSLNNLAVNYAYQEQFAVAADLTRRALAILEQRLGPDHPNTQSSRQSLAAIEQRLAGTAAPPSAEAQIAQLTQQAEAAVAQALAGGSHGQRVALKKQIEDVASRIEQNEKAAVWLALADHLRDLAAQLEPGESPK